MSKAAYVQANQARTNKLVNIHWKVSEVPDKIDANASGPFMQRLYDLEISAVEETEEVEENEDEVDWWSDPPTLSFPSAPATIFSPLAVGPAPSPGVLEHHWTKPTVRAWHPGASHSETDKEATGNQRKAMLDEKRLNMLGIFLQKYLMENRGESNQEAILNIKRAVLRCDFYVVRLEGLSVIRTALRQHEKDKKPVCAFVQEHGESALEGLPHPEHHRLVYELSKVPQIDERLECMLFHVTFEESLATCRANLQALHDVLDMLNAKRETIQRFFVTAHRLGQSLNKESNAPQAPRGFQLSTLEKLPQTRSTKLPKLSLLHFVLAIMDPQDAEDLFNPEDVGVLQAAKALKTHKVYQDCVDLAQGLYGVHQICETGKYTCPATGEAVRMQRRRKSLPSSAAEAATEQQPWHPPETPGGPVDVDDRFHEVMQDFVDQNLEKGEDVAEGALNMILDYKELALYFEDLRSVYPPPKNESDPKKDLCEIFYKFAEDIRKHRNEVLSDNLRSLLLRRTEDGEVGSLFDGEMTPGSYSSGSAAGSGRFRFPSRSRCGDSLEEIGSGVCSPTGFSGTSRSRRLHELAFTPKQDTSPINSATSPSKSTRLGSPSRSLRFRNRLVDRFVENELDHLEKLEREGESPLPMRGGS